MSIRIPITISSIAAFAVITINALAPIVDAAPEDEDAFPSLSPTLGVVELAGLEPEPEEHEISVQSKILAIMVKCTAIPSIMGSAFIVFEVLRDTQKRGKSYHRLLLAMSISDILSSSAIFVGSWAIPKDTEGVYQAYGTETTCKIQGFFIQLGIVTPLYNGMLALYYFFSINWGWKEYQIHSIEKYLHAVPLAWGFSTAIACALFDVYDNATLWCWLGNEREISNVLRYALYYGPVILMLLMTTAIMISIYRFVRAREKLVEKYDFRRSIEKSLGSDRHNRRSSELFRGSMTQLSIQAIVNGINFNASDTGTIRRESISSQISNEGGGIRESENGPGNPSNEISDCDMESHYGDDSDIEVEDDDEDDDNDDASIDKDEHDDDNSKENSNDNINVKSINIINTINIKNSSMEFELIKSERNMPYTINEDRSNHFDEDFIASYVSVDDNTKDVRDKSGDCGSQELKTSETTNRRFYGRLAALFSRSTSDSDRDRSDDKSTDGRSDNRSCQSSVDEFGVKTTRTMRQVARKTKHSKRVMIQSLWYIIAFYVSFIFACTARIYGSVTGGAPFPLLLLFSIFFPLQGFFNFLVYMRSRLRRLFKKSPNTSSAGSGARRQSGSNASRKHDTESSAFSKIMNTFTPTPNNL